MSEYYMHPRPGKGSDGNPLIPMGDGNPMQVAGQGDLITITPVVQIAGAYVANEVVGGIQTLAAAMRVAGGRGMLESLMVFDHANQKAALNIFLFDQLPVGTYADHVAFTMGAADGPKCLGVAQVAAADYLTVGSFAYATLGAGSGRVWQALMLKALGAADPNLYAVIQTTGTPTYVAATDLQLRFGFLQN